MSEERPDFEALRKRRNKAVLAILQEAAKRLGWKEGDPPLFSTFDPNACYCACSSGGPCEHDWSGPVEDFDGGYSATCKRCGCSAINHDMANAP